MRLRAKVDDNQAEIVKALREAGCSVQSLAAIGKGCPDILACNRRNGLFLIEIKDGAKSASRRQLTDDQVLWHQAWVGPVYVVTSAAEALALVADKR